MCLIDIHTKTKAVKHILFDPVALFSRPHDPIKAGKKKRSDGSIEMGLSGKSEAQDPETSCLILCQFQLLGRGVRDFGGGVSNAFFSGHSLLRTEHLLFDGSFFAYFFSPSWPRHR